MTYGKRSLAVVGALALCALGLSPASWARDAGEDEAAAPGGAGIGTVSAQPTPTPTESAMSGEGASPSPSPEAAQSGPGAEAVTSQESEADTPIADIQALGEGDDSALTGTSVTTLGVVTASYPAGESSLTGTLDGYTIQTPGTGGTWEEGKSRSDALFVYAGKKGRIPAVGTCVRVSGTVGEFPATTAKGNPESLTQLAAATVTEVSGCQAPKPTPMTGVPRGASAESYESMLLAPQGTWTITDNYQANLYGTLTLTPGDAPLRAATDVVAPGQAARDYEADNASKAIELDDGANTNLQKGTATEAPYAYLANGSPARVGYHATFSAPVILDVRHGSWILQPTSMVAAHPDRSPITITGARPSAPTVGGDTRVATFNVLNYFSDLGVDEAGCTGYPDRTGAFVTTKKCRVRGAYSREAFANQEAKIVSAINALGAHVVALEEIENPVGVGVGTDRDASLARLVSALNKAAGTAEWAYVPSPPITPAGEDVIRVAFIYKPAIVTPVGDSLIHDDPAFPGLAEGNRDNGDGQGNANAIRVAQASALATFAARFADKPTLLVGDFNSYSQEDPVRALTDRGWKRVSGQGEASYVYSGRSGSLDHVFANAAATPLLAGVTSWAVNAQESVAFEYSRAGMNAHLRVEADNPYRSSDHNPEIIGLTLLTPTPGADPSPSAEPGGPAPSALPSPPPGSKQPQAPSAAHKRRLAATGSHADHAVLLGSLLACAGGVTLGVSRRWRRRS